jgi:hypothetical protein
MWLCSIRGFVRFFLIREFFEKWNSELVNRVNKESAESGQRDRLVSELGQKQKSNTLTYEDEQLGNTVARLDKTVQYQQKQQCNSVATFEPM